MQLQLQLLQLQKEWHEFFGLSLCNCRCCNCNHEGLSFHYLNSSYCGSNNEIHIQFYYSLLKSFAPGNFAKKCVLKLVKPFSVGFLAKNCVAFWSCRCKTLAFEVGHVQNAKFWCDSLCLFFLLSHLPFSFALLASFFPFCWAFSWHFSENVFGKAFRILGLDERKGFLREFSGQCYIDGFLPFTLATLTELCSFWMVWKLSSPCLIYNKVFIDH